MTRRDAPIGIFDSGLGGLTVVRAIAEALPSEHLIYLGDTARVPYGTRSANTVLRYARTCSALLAKHGIKLLVVACNTVSAVALDMLQIELDLPVLGVIEPGARAAVEASSGGRIGVIATAGTVASNAYPRAVASCDTRLEVAQQPAPLLVPLAEEGWLEGEVPRLVVRRYLEALMPKERGGLDALVLGCTHYPLLAPIIQEQANAIAGSPVRVIESGVAVAAELRRMLEARDQLRPLDSAGDLRVMVTDRPGKFAEVASRFLGRDVESFPVEQVDL